MNISSASNDMGMVFNVSCILFSSNLTPVNSQKEQQSLYRCVFKQGESGVGKSTELFTADINMIIICISFVTFFVKILSLKSKEKQNGSGEVIAA